jgi:hypothetical protein
MIKFILAGLWLCAVTLGTVYWATVMTAKDAGAKAEQPPPYFGGLDYVKTDILSVPVVREQRITGYFLARLVYTVEPKMLKKLTIRAETLITDQVYTHLYANPQIDFAQAGGLDLDSFRAGIRDSVNARVGGKLIHEVLVEQLDFLTKEEIRDNTIRRKAAGIEASPPPMAAH